MTTSTKTTDSLRDKRYADKHDPIYYSLDWIANWLIFGHLSLAEKLQGTERDRLNKFHLLMRDTARRFTGNRDLDALGWFLREEGNGADKRFHFHFAITGDNLENTTADVVCRYLNNQWLKIGKSVCQIETWDITKTPLGIWYLTQMDETPAPHSRYFRGDNCRWKMSTLLYSRILERSKERHINETQTKTMSD